MEFVFMNEKVRTVSLLVTLVAFSVAGGGCTSLNPDHFLPESIVPAASDRRIDGSVNVQAYAPSISKSRVLYFESGMLRVAVEKAIVQKGLFQRVDRGDADFVLDVWVMDAAREIKVTGEGYVIDVTSIWRLTRTRDGKVIVCDFANGHGVSRAVGTNAHMAALEASTRDMIRKGLSALTDRSTPLAAAYFVEDWPSMGPVVPEGHGKLKENLRKLRTGLTEKEVQGLIPSMTNADRNGDGHVVVYRSPVFDQKSANGALHEVPSPFFPFRVLEFVDGRLIRWVLNK
jgi:hypothetical protein